MNQRTSYYLKWVSIMLLLWLLDMASTYYCNASLNYDPNNANAGFITEGNPLAAKIQAGWFGLFLITFFFTALYCIAFYFHAVLFKPIDYTFSKSSKIVDLFCTYLFRDHRLLRGDLQQAGINLLFSILNAWVFHTFFVTLFNKVIFILQNILLGFRVNNARITKDGDQITIRYNDNPLWDTIWGDIVRFYDIGSITRGVDGFWLDNFAFQLVSILVFGWFCRKEYKNARKRAV